MQGRPRAWQVSGGQCNVCWHCLGEELSRSLVDSAMCAGAAWVKSSATDLLIFTLGAPKCV